MEHKFPRRCPLCDHDFDLFSGDWDVFGNCCKSCLRVSRADYIEECIAQHTPITPIWARLFIVNNEPDAFPDDGPAL